MSAGQSRGVRIALFRFGSCDKIQENGCVSSTAPQGASGDEASCSRMPRTVSKKFAATFRAPREDVHAPPSAVPERALASDTLIRIDLDRQRLELHVRGRLDRTYPVSTAANGPGEQEGSECTPRGVHVVRAKIGAGAAPGTVFVGRRPTGERYTATLGAATPGRDWILTRILWLSGTEPGRNRLGRVDTMRRYIYIHGCPDDVDITSPGSHGCIRMRNDDVIALFDRVEPGTRVVIETQSPGRGAAD